MNGVLTLDINETRDEDSEREGRKKTNDSYLRSEEATFIHRGYKSKNEGKNERRVTSG